MRPKYCPNCASPLPDTPNAAQYYGASWSDATDGGWACFCENCYWSGDIEADYQTETVLLVAKEKAGLPEG